MLFKKYKQINRKDRAVAGVRCSHQPRIASNFQNQEEARSLLQSLQREHDPANNWPPEWEGDRQSWIQTPRLCQLQKLYNINTGMKKSQDRDQDHLNGMYCCIRSRSRIRRRTSPVHYSSGNRHQFSNAASLITESKLQNQGPFQLLIYNPVYLMLSVLIK